MSVSLCSGRLCVFGSVGVFGSTDTPVLKTGLSNSAMLYAVQQLRLTASSESLVYVNSKQLGL